MYRYCCLLLSVVNISLFIYYFSESHVYKDRNKPCPGPSEYPCITATVDFNILSPQVTCKKGLNKTEKSRIYQAFRSQMFLWLFL